MHLNLGSALVKSPSCQASTIASLRKFMCSMVELSKSDYGISVIFNTALRLTPGRLAYRRRLVLWILTLRSSGFDDTEIVGLLCDHKLPSELNSLI